MNSFSSILASIGGSKKAGENASPSPVSLAKAKPSSLPSSPNPQAQKKMENTLSTGMKRKAEATTSEQAAKQPRTEPSAKNASNISPSAKNGVIRPTGNLSNPSASPATVVTATKPPKNSFREILARAELAKSKQNDFGQIKHKHIVKPTKRQLRLAREAELKAKPKLSQAGRITKPQKQSGRLEPQQARKSPKVDLGYKGTMRPKPTLPDYKGTMKPSGSGATAKARTLERRPAYYSRYSDEEEEDDGYDDDEEEDDGDEGSVMDATGFEELEREEEESLRAARKEDEEALKEENERRRQKAEKRKRLEALAAARAARR